MRKLSRLNLLNEVLEEEEQPKGGFLAFLEKALETKCRELVLTIPKYYYIRGQMYAKYLDSELVDLDLDLEYEFGVKQLIYIIYEDYIHLIQKGANLRAYAKHLMNRKELVMHGALRESGLERDKRHGAHYASYNAVEKQRISPALSPYLTDSTVDVRLRMLKEDIVHGEVIVHDIRRQYQDFNLTLEEMIQIRYVDIMDSIIMGDSEGISNGIIKLMKTYEYKKFRGC